LVSFAREAKSGTLAVLLPAHRDVLGTRTTIGTSIANFSGNRAAAQNRSIGAAFSPDHGLCGAASMAIVYVIIPTSRAFLISGRALKEKSIRA